jgi:hypothetical protein
MRGDGAGGWSNVQLDTFADALGQSRSAPAPSPATNARRTSLIHALYSRALALCAGSHALPRQTAASERAFSSMRSINSSKEATNFSTPSSSMVFTTWS